MAEDTDEDDRPDIALGQDLRDFAAQPITAQEMARAVERAQREHLGRGTADLHAVLLQEAAKALRRGPELLKALEGAHTALGRIREYAIREAAEVRAAQEAKPDGREF